MSSEDHLALIELFQCVVGSAATVVPDVQLVFILRSSQLALMDDLTRSVTPGPGAPGVAEARLSIQPLEAPAAREIIEELVRRLAPKPEWPVGLHDRIVEDLATEQIRFGRTRRVISAAELQVVCHVVGRRVAMRRIRAAADYPGKQELRSAYIGGIIRSVSTLSPPRMQELLLHFTGEDDPSRSVSRLLSQLAKELRVRPQVLGPVLSHLSQNHGLLVKFSHRSEQGELQTGYRLAAHYLAGLIRQTTGDTVSGTRRSEAILRMARMRAEYRPGYRLSLRDYLYVGRHRPQKMSRGERAIVRRTARGLVLRSFLGGLAIAAIAVVRFASHRIELEKDELVLKRGLPILHPLLGADDVAVATGISRQDLPSGSEVTRWLFEPIAQSSRIYWPGPRRLGPSFNVQSALREQLATTGSAYLEQKRNAYSRQSSFSDSTVADWLIIASDSPPDQSRGQSPLASYFQTRLLASFQAVASRCQAEKQRSTECSEAYGALETLAANLLKAGAFGEDHEKAVQFFIAKLTEARPGSWQFDVALAVLRLWRGHDPSLRSSLIGRLSDRAVDLRAALIAALASLPRTPQETLPKLLQNPALLDELSSQFLAVLEDGSAPLKDRLEALNTLVSLGAAGERLLKFLSAQLEHAKLTAAADATRSTDTAPAEPPAAAAPTRRPGAVKRSRAGARRGASRREGPAPAVGVPAAAPIVAASAPGSSPAPAPASEQTRASIENAAGTAAKPLESLPPIEVLRALIKLKLGNKDLKVNSALIVASTLYGLRGQEFPSSAKRPDREPADPLGARPVAPWSGPKWLPYIDLIGSPSYHWNQLFGDVRSDEVRDALEQVLRSYLDGPYRTHQSTYRRTGELDRIIQAARRAGVSVHEVVGWLPARDYALAEPGDYEQNLLSALEAVYSIDDAEEDRILKEQRVLELRTELVRWVHEYIEQEGSGGCRWAAVALSYQVLHPAIEKKIYDLDCRQVSALTRAYAQFRLLRHTRGFDQGARLGAISSGEMAYKSESFQGACVRLLGLLSSPSADGCSTYRSAVSVALLDLLQQVRDQADGGDLRAELLRRIAKERLRPDYPLQRQLALLQVWTALSTD